MFHLHEHNPHLYLRYKQTCEISGFDEGSNPVGYDVLPTFRKSLPLPFCMQYKTMAQDRHIQAEISSLARYLVSRGDGALKSVIFVERIPQYINSPMIRQHERRDKNLIYATEKHQGSKYIIYELCCGILVSYSCTSLAKFQLQTVNLPPRTQCLDLYLRKILTSLEVN